MSGELLRANRSQGEFLRDQEIQVVVADPNKHMRYLLAELLRQTGLRSIREASDGAEALEMLQDRPTDLLFTEYQMEPVDGLALTREIRNAEDSPNPFLPIVMVTAYTAKPVVTAARNAGVTEFMAKPFTAQVLQSRLKAIIYKARPFVRTKVFFGPDRRRRWDYEFQGPDRRNLPAETLEAPSVLRGKGPKDVDTDQADGTAPDADPPAREDGEATGATAPGNEDTEAVARPA